MSLRVRQRERASPRTAKDHPLFNAQMLPQLLDVRNQMPGCVFYQGSVRSALARASLVEQDNSISRRVKEAAIIHGQAGARAAMKKDNWLAVGIPTLFVINVMNFRHLQHPVLIRFYWIVKS